MTRALLLVFLTGVAWADPPAAPSAERTKDANLEPTGGLSTGITFAFALAPDMVLGVGAGGDVGTGGIASIRVGQVATPDTVISLEINAGSVLVHQRQMEIYQNTAFNFVLGAQRYVLESLWIRLAGGIGNYTRRGQFDVAGAAAPDQSLSGPVGVFGVGIDAIRLTRKTVLDVELVSSFLVERHGVTVVGGIGIGIARY